MSEGTLLAVYEFPKIWPPCENIEIIRKCSNNEEIKLIADTNGRLKFCIDTKEKTNKYLFQPISVEGNGLNIICIRWSNLEVELTINGNKIIHNINAKDEPYNLILKDQPQYCESPIIGHINIPTNASNAEKLFLETILDIEKKISSGSDYDLIRSAGLLRQLFIDENPLVHAVNRNYRIEIVFKTADCQKELPEGLEKSIHISMLDSSKYPSAKTIESNIKNFLKAPCFKHDGTTATVKDLIKACANAKGGVHLGRGKTDEENSVLNLDEISSILGKEPSLLLVSDICKVSLKALLPLKNAILEK